MQRNLGLVVGALATELHSWLDGEACKAVQLLRSCAWLAEDGLTPHLPVLLDPMCQVRCIQTAAQWAAAGCARL